MKVLTKQYLFMNGVDDDDFEYYILGDGEEPEIEVSEEYGSLGEEDESTFAVQFSTGFSIESVTVMDYTLPEVLKYAREQCEKYRCKHCFIG